MEQHGKIKVFAIFFALAAIACSGGETPPPSSSAPAGYSRLWAEFLSPSEIDGALPLLAKHRIGVSVAWRADADPGPLTDLVARARAHGVEVEPWLLLADADGYWPGSTNVDRFSAAVQALFSAWDAKALEPGELVVDMELRKDRADQLNALLSAKNPDTIGAVTLLDDSMNSAEYASATDKYAALVSDAHARGWKVHLTTLPQVLDDYADGDDDLRQAFGIPIEGIAWDLTTFQAYRTLFGDLLGTPGSPPSSYFVYSYATDAKARFGDRAGLDLGMVGGGVTASSVYASGADLEADVSAAYAAGIEPTALDVYGLDGILQRSPSEQWIPPPPKGRLAPAPDDATAAIRQKVALLDSVL